MCKKPELLMVGGPRRFWGGWLTDENSNIVHFPSAPPPLQSQSQPAPNTHDHWAADCLVSSPDGQCSNRDLWITTQVWRYVTPSYDCKRFFGCVFDPDENVIYVTQIYFLVSGLFWIIQHPVHIGQCLGDTCGIVDGIVFRQLAPWLDQIEQGPTQIRIR